MPNTADIRAAFAMLPADRRKEILRSMRKLFLLAQVTLPSRVPARSTLVRSEGR